MEKLTDWLDGLKLTPVARHPKFPALVQPPNFQERPPAPCVSCLQQGKEGHEEYGCGRVTAPLPAPHLADVQTFKSIQYILSRLSADLFPPYGAGSFQYYGEASVNFTTTMGLTVTEAEGNRVRVTGEPDLRTVPLFLIMRGNIGAPGRSIMPIYGSLQPNSIGTPGNGSILDGKVSARLERIHYNTPTEADLFFDQDMSGIMVDNRDDQTEPYEPAIFLLGQYGDKEKWTRVVDPSVFKALRRLMSVSPADLPPNGHLNLLRNDGTEGRVAIPEAAEGTRPATMKLWVKLSTQEELVDMTSEVFGRLKMISTGPGWNYRGAYRSILCLGEADHEGDPAFTSLLTPEVEQIIVDYWAEIPDGYTGKDWCAVGGDRCAHALRDESASYYHMTDGEAHIPPVSMDPQPEGVKEEEWFCGIRRTWEIVETQDGKWRVKWSKPARSELFTASCSLYGVCPSFSPIHRAPEGTRPFTLHRTANQILKEATAGHNIGLVQYWPGWPNYYVKRMGRPTIHGMTTGVPTTNPGDWSPNVWYVQDGPNFVGDFATEQLTAEYNEWDELISPGGELLKPLIGGAWDGRVAFSELTFGDIPPPGIFPTNIAGWQSRIDALRRPLTDENDPWRSGRYYEDDMSARTNRNPAATTSFGRGVSQAVRTVGGDESFLMPKLDVNDGTAGTPQEFACGVTFTWFEQPQEGPDGWQYHVLFEFKPLIATGKTPRGEIKSAVIAGATHLENDDFYFELENLPEQWSQLRNEGHGNSWNETFTLATGGKIFRPPDFLQIRSSATVDSSYGGADDWVSIGDAAWIDYADEEFKAHRFTVVGGGAYMGSAADDFGPSPTHISFDLVGGYYQVTEADMDIGSGNAGLPGIASAVTSLQVTDEAQEINFTSQPPFANSQYLKVDGTDEVLMVSSVDPNNNSIWVIRSIGSVAAQPIPPGTEITQILAFDYNLEIAYEPINSNGDERPATIPTGKYWFDRKALRYYFSPEDWDTWLRLSFYIDDDTGTPKASNSRMVWDYQVFREDVDGTTYHYPVFDTGKTPEQFEPAGGSATIFIDGNEMDVLTQEQLDEQIAAPPPDGGPLKKTQVLKMEDSNGHVVLLAHREHAGKPGRLEIDAGDSSFNLDIADVPEFATGIGWGKKRAVAKLRDENLWLRASVTAGSLVGKTIHFVRHEQILHPDSMPQIHWTKWQEDDYETALTSWFLPDRGRGRLMGTASMLEAMRAVPGRILCGLID